MKTIKTGSIDIRRDVDGVMWATNRDELFKAREDKVGSIIELPASVEIIESALFWVKWKRLYATSLPYLRVFLPADALSLRE